MPSRLRRSAPLLLASLVLAACESPYQPVDIPESGARMSRRAQLYLDSALSLMQSHSLHRHEVSWPAFREEMYGRATGAEAPEQTYGAISMALQKLNRHSFFIPPSEEPGRATPPSLWPPLAAGVLAGRFGWVRTATFNTSGADEHAQQYHDLIRAADAVDPCGWVVDLRFNPGGNMWPMLAGIGPILGEGSPGAFIDADGVRMPWFYEGGVAGVIRGGQRFTASRVGRPYQLRRPDPPVAVLTDRNTASAAEAIAIAFRGRANTRSFGLATNGVPTANTVYGMPDGATVVLTTAWEADRDGVRYEGTIVPHELISGVITQTPNPQSDDTLARALAWLADQPACRAAAN